MSEDKDRRTQIRFQIPDASLYIKHSDFISMISGYKGPQNVIDLSKSGAGLFYNKPVKKGEVVKIMLEFPDQQKLTLKGEIRWISEDSEDGMNRIGIQFFPFGYNRPYNSLDNLKRLNSLNEKYTIN